MNPMGAPRRQSSAYIWLASLIASFMVAMSLTWLPTWKCSRVSLCNRSFFLRTDTACNTSNAPSPNLASSPDVAPHCPSCVVPRRTLIPSAGVVRVVSVSSSLVRITCITVSSSLGFSKTSTVVTPLAAAANARRTYFSSLYPLQINSGSGVCSCFPNLFSFFLPKDTSVFVSGSSITWCVVSLRTRVITAIAKSNSALLPASSPNPDLFRKPSITSAVNNSASWQHFTGNTPWYRLP
mmetsp:Transcript_13125/g.43490  ORF Transcript_13125/g.43490 Transcript_13125/m.43490 type:complete len:238 (+) Transcript_13125:1568-2281(+)